MQFCSLFRQYWADGGGLDTGVDGGDGTALSFFSSSLFSWKISSNDSDAVGVSRCTGVFVGVVDDPLCTALLLRDLLLQAGVALATARCFSGGPKSHTKQVNLCM